jgi:hypothetical protein
VSPVIWWRIIVFAALVAAGWYIVDVIGDNRELRSKVEEQGRTITQLGDRATALEQATIENDTFDSATRDQQQTVKVVVSDARRSDPDAAKLLDTPLPAALRKRVFLNDDPASGSAEPAPAPAAGKDRG